MNKTVAEVAVGVACLILNVVPCARAVDQDYVENSEFTKAVTISFAGTSATVVNGAGLGVTYEQKGAGIIITSAVAGVEYILSGTAANGYLQIQSACESKLTLNGVSLTSTNGPAIAIHSTNRCFVVLAEGTSNGLTDGSNYTQNGGGALCSTGPLIFSGRGGVTVTGKKKHGIDSGMYIRMRGGDIVVPAAAKDGLHANQCFRMDNGLLTVAATGDGIDGDEGYVEINGGSITIQSTADDVTGIQCDGSLTVNGGAINMTVSGVQSKGLRSAGNMVINGGTLMFNLSGAVYLKTVTTVITNGGIVRTNSYVDPSYCTAIKCDTNITFNAGTITITHTGTAGKGISAGRNMTVFDGTFDILTAGGCSASFTNSAGVRDVAAADCMKADGNLSILGGRITALATGNAGDGISAEGTAVIGIAGISNTPIINVATRGQKVLVSGSGMSADYANPKAFQAVGNLTVNGGVFRATTRNDGGEGLESKAQLTINGGTIEVTAYDDCINAANSITINGGMIYCYSMGNDGIDANGTLRINGGTIVSSGTTAPEEGFDCDQNTFAITGGIMVGAGGGTSTPTSASCTQRSVKYTGAGTSGVILQVKSASGNNLVYRIPRTYSGGGGPMPGGGMVMLFSNPGITAGTTYTIVTNATVTGGTEFHGLYTGATVTGGTTVKTFTASTTSMVTTVQ